MAKLVRLYPIGHTEPDGRWFGYLVDGVAPVIQDVTPERAAELLAWYPPAFTTDPPGLESSPGSGIAATRVVNLSPTDPAPAGSPDS